MNQVIHTVGIYTAIVTKKDECLYELHEAQLLLTYFERYRSALLHFLLRHNALSKTLTLSHTIPQDVLIIWDIQKL